MMRTRKCFVLMLSALLLASAGAAAAQVKPAAKAAKAAKATKPAKAKATKQKAEQSKAAKQAAEQKAQQPGAEGQPSGQEQKPAKQGQQPAAASGQAQTQEQQQAGQQQQQQQPQPAGQGEQRFFRQQQQPYRFLQRSETRLYPGPIVGPSPHRPPPDMPPEPPRERGDAGAAMAVALAVQCDWNLHHSYDLFGQDDMTPKFDLWFGYDLLSLSPRAILAAEIGVGTGIETADGLFTDLETSLQTTRLLAAANLRYVLIPMLQPHLRLAATGSFINAEMDFADGEHFEDDEFSAAASLGAGFTVRTPTRLFENRKGQFASLSIGMLFEGGYALASPVSLALLTEEEEGRIDIRDAPLGELALSGPYFRSSLVVRF